MMSNYPGMMEPSEARLIELEDLNAEMLEALKGLLTTRCLETYDWDGVKALINKAENKAN